MHPMKHACLPPFFLALLIALPGLAVADAHSEFDIEGKYEQVKPAQPTETGADTVEVVDVFWFGCPHCFTFLPHMEGLEQDAPDHLRIRRMPAVFRESWIPHARAYYTAHLLGIEDRVHRPIFEAIHVHGRSLSTREALAAFFAEHGVDVEEFGKVYDSFAVESLVRKSVAMQRKYGVSATPTVIVNGKYRTSGNIAGGHANVIKVIRALAEREHAS